MTAEREFQRLQREFTRYLRNPDRELPPPGQEPRRLAIYAHAVYANVVGLMTDNYPRVRAVFDDEHWSAMMRDYIVQHESLAGAFVDVPREFLAYLDSERQLGCDRPFLRELAHFDWLETLIGADTRVLDLTAIERDGDLLLGVPVANPIMRLVTYSYPVHAINAAYHPTSPPSRATVIAAFRDPHNLYGFLDLNAAAARLLSLIIESDARSGQDLLDQMAVELNHDDRTGFINAGRSILADMRQAGAVLGTRRIS